MNLTSFNHVGPSLPATPPAVIFSTQLLLTQETSVQEKTASLDQKVKLIETRAHRLTSTLEHIKGFRHGGLID